VETGQRRRQGPGSLDVLLLDDDLVAPDEDWSDLPLLEIVPQWYGAARAAWLASQDSEEQ
jgi:hypothetical protein